MNILSRWLLLAAMAAAPELAAAQEELQIEPPEGCFCLADEDGQLMRDCERKKFPGQPWSAICRHLRADGAIVAEPVGQISDIWTVVLPDDPKCTPCNVRRDSGNGNRRVTASRAFSGPHEFPPVDFAAYGILAFPALATSVSRARHLMICESYVASLEPSDRLKIPPERQMVTIWPVTSSKLAVELNSKERQHVCEVAVDNYDLLTGQISLQHAQIANADVSGIGPYLLAWSPSSDKGKPDVLVLQVDLSDVTTDEQVIDIMRDWRRDIEQNPDLWPDGWNIEAVRMKIRLWADKYGSHILSVIGK